MSMRYKDHTMETDATEQCNDDRTPLPSHPVVGMAYVPFQQFSQKNLYTADNGFEQGTIFRDLDKPFTGCPGDLQ